MTENLGGEVPFGLHIIPFSTPKLVVFESLVCTTAHSWDQGKGVWGGAWTVFNPPSVVWDFGKPWVSADIPGQCLPPPEHSFLLSASLINSMFCLLCVLLCKLGDNSYTLNFFGILGCVRQAAPIQANFVNVVF